VTPAATLIRSATITAVTGRPTRRGFLGAGAAGVGASLAGGLPRANAATAVTARAGRQVAFYGRHQAGIATATQQHINFLALDLRTDVVGELAALLAALSQAAERMTRGEPVGRLGTGSAPPVDTGEAVGLAPSRLTVTFGLGPRVFARGRFGLEAQRPAPLVSVPPFATDSLQPSICGGDVGVQACAEDPQVAFHAIHQLIRLAGPAAAPRWSLAGFGRTRNHAGGSTPRNLFGFKEGTGNIMAEDAAAMGRFVWAGPPESPAWMAGGSYMVLRRIRTLLADWDSIGLDQQERTFGRHKLSGAPLGARREFDPLDLDATSHGDPVIPRFAHVRLTSPEHNGGERLLRRGYSYLEGVDGGDAGAGQLFICYQRDPRRQFIPIQRQLALTDALNAHTEHIGSAIFACPPGCQPGGHIGDSLLRA
jgi:deferrochelatase/peroxidase EfeB